MEGIQGQAPVVAEEVVLWVITVMADCYRGRKIMNDIELFAPEAMLTPGEVAELFHVNIKTVGRWARAGKLVAIRTLGGHRRYRVSEVKRALAEANRSTAS
jgi:excisionase family DNA binding protein